MYKVYSKAKRLDIDPIDMPLRPPETGILMVSPEHYDVLYVINPHMEGKVGTVDKERAKEQWRKLVATYISIGYPVFVLEGDNQFPDMVFCANQSFPYWDEENRPSVIISRMASHYRQGEEVHFEHWYTGVDLEIY